MKMAWSRTLMVQEGEVVGFGVYPEGRVESTCYWIVCRVGSMEESKVTPRILA